MIRPVKNQQQENSERTGLPLGTERHVRRTRLFANGTNPSAPSGTASGASHQKKSKHTLVIVDTSRLAGEAIADAAAIAMTGSRPGRGRV
jgi:hypothetical protein